MVINLSFYKNICEFAVVNKISKKSDIELFINKITSIENEHINITFFEAKYLPEKIIKTLLNLEKDKKIKIFVFNKILYSYLYKLSFQVKILKSKSLTINPNYIKVLAIGGSAGSFDFISYLLNNLRNSEVIIFIIQHIPEDSKSSLDEILKKYTDLNIKFAENNEYIKCKNIYIAPAGFQMKIAKGKILLTKAPYVNFARPSIDVLFESLSEYYKNDLAIVLLSGYNDDGSHSLEKIQKNKSKILIQDPKETEHNELLLNAIKTSYYDYIMPVPEITHYIKRYLPKKDDEIEISELELSIFLASINEKYGYDYKNYSKDNVLRMIKKEMRNTNIYYFNDFVEKILTNSLDFESLFLTLSINVTEFFRDPEVFKFVKNKLFEYITDTPNIKIWCSGCSTGEEPYSLAILLKEANLLAKTQIYATDINPYIVEQAKNGFFSKDSVENSFNNYISIQGNTNFKNYFDDLGNCYQIKDELKNNILFFEHSLLNEGIINEFDIIFCRNVLIYFNNELFNKTINLLYKSLANNGFLILGKAEDIINNNNFMVYNSYYKIYKKSFKFPIF
ncbi:MAG: CheR family methyltransferase [Cyanobacteriota bacterium]